MASLNFCTVCYGTSAGLDRLSCHHKLDNSTTDIHNELHIHLLTQVYCVTRKLEAVMLAVIKIEQFQQHCTSVTKLQCEPVCTSV